jgi:hypothetical protein
LFNVESGRFLLALSSWVSFVVVVDVVGVVVVVAVGGNLCCYTSTNQ